jgi:2-C-methyl-D-erythritol 2,4-cyclodiphosphate synthase
MNGPSTAFEMRVGQGFDIHRFTDDPNRVLVLGGVLFEGSPGLEGHSDADVVAHACADALLGAGGLGDIGEHFPDTDPAWDGADSIALLRHVTSLLAEQSWAVDNIDCAVVCEQPKLAPARSEMQQILTSAVGAPVSIKGNRAERLGAIGRGEGIMCFATALIHRVPKEHI